MICTLCPRMCGGERTPARGAGWCGLPSTVKVARCALHQWEEPCISGTRGAGTIFFSGCTLGCIFCQNYAISRERRGRELTPQQLREEMEQLVSQGAHNIELVTPTQYTHILSQVLEAPLPVPVVWNSGGYERVESLKMLEGKVDIYLPDLKYLSPQLGENYSKVKEYPQIAKAAITEMVRQCGDIQMKDGLLKRGVIIRHLLLPGHVNEAKQVMDWVAASFPKHTVLFSLMAQYTPMGDLEKFPNLTRTVRPSEVRAAQQYMNDLGLLGYVQDIEAVGEQFVPQWEEG